MVNIPLSKERWQLCHRVISTTLPDSSKTLKSPCHSPESVSGGVVLARFVPHKNAADIKKNDLIFPV